MESTKSKLSNRVKVFATIIAPKLACMNTYTLHFGLEDVAIELKITQFPDCLMVTFQDVTERLYRENISLTFSIPYKIDLDETLLPFLSDGNTSELEAALIHELDDNTIKELIENFERDNPITSTFQRLIVATNNEDTYIQSKEVYIDKLLGELSAYQKELEEMKDKNNVEQIGIVLNQKENVIQLLREATA